MGKSDIIITTTKIEMSETDRPKLFTIGPCQKDPDEYGSGGLKLSSDVEMYTNQAAGHMTNGKTIVYDVASGKVDRYDKDYGKTLNRESIKEALKLFLNANVGLNRDLLLQFVVELWKILRWARLEKKFQLFSSSLLFVYDAKRLKKKVVAQHATEKPLRETRNQSLPSYDTNLKRFNLYKPLSLLKLNDSVPTGFSGLFTKEGPILCSLPSKIKHFCSTSVRDKTRRSSEQVNRLRRVHSFQNNYDKDLQKIRKDYKDMLRTLVDEEECETWAVVKMIDFAHVHTIAHNEVDRNYLEGIESLVKLFEEFLGETGNS